MTHSQTQSDEATNPYRPFERILKRFEEAWRQGPRPAIADFWPVEGVDRLALLSELVCLDLAQRLKDGDPARVDDYLKTYPELVVSGRISAPPDEGEGDVGGVFSGAAAGDSSGNGLVLPAVSEDEIASGAIPGDSSGNGAYVLDAAFTAGPSPLQPIGVNTNLSSIVTGDFNHDGNLDIVTTDNVINGVTLFAGQGDGSFQAGNFIDVEDAAGRGPTLSP